MAYKKIHWTEHAKIKMRQYGLSKYKLMQMLHKYERKERGIVPGTIAVMQSHRGIAQKNTQNNAERNWAKRRGGEVWLMYKDVKEMRKIISAWRYPGVSKPGEQIPIPEDIKREILANGNF